MSYYRCLCLLFLVHAACYEPALADVELFTYLQPPDGHWHPEREYVQVPSGTYDLAAIGAAYPSPWLDPHGFEVWEVEVLVKLISPDGDLEVWEHVEGTIDDDDDEIGIRWVESRLLDRVGVWEFSVTVSVREISDGIIGDWVTREEIVRFEVIPP